MDIARARLKTKQETRETYYKDGRNMIFSPGLADGYNEGVYNEEMTSRGLDTIANLIRPCLLNVSQAFCM